MSKPLQSDIIGRLERLVEVEHCSGCDSNTCDVSVAFRLGYGLWAIELFAGSGAASDDFERNYAQLGRGFHKSAEAERKLLCEEPHTVCDCNAIIWLPEECDYSCDSCGKQIPENKRRT